MLLEILELVYLNHFFCFKTSFLKKTDKFFTLYSLQPLVAFISGKMRTMAAMFDINEDYITNVSSMIQSAVAKIGFDHGGLKRHYSAYGKDSLMAILTEKLSSADVTLPKGVTPNYVVTMVTDFVKDSLR